VTDVVKYILAQTGLANLMLKVAAALKEEGTETASAASCAIFRVTSIVLIWTPHA
jgi:hypothetical protein